MNQIPENWDKNNRDILDSITGWRTMRVILGDQLSEYHSWYTEPQADVLYVMMEVIPEATYTRHHIQKLVAIFSAMRLFAARLIQLGHRVVYVTIIDQNNRQDFVQNYKFILEKLKKPARNLVLEYQEPDEYRLQRYFTQGFQEFPLPIHMVDTEHFIAEPGDFQVKEGVQGKEKPPVMEYFYRNLRRKTGILMDPIDNQKPLGGQWNYDQENRKSWKGNPPAPEITPDPRYRIILQQVLEDIHRAEIPSLGTVDLEMFFWPLDRVSALKTLDDFNQNKLTHFGPFQDAMAVAEPYLFHSLLSFALNTKILHPLEVLRATVDFLGNSFPENLQPPGSVEQSTSLNTTNKNLRNTPTLASVEGFVRQILGWREYMRQYYRWSMPDFSQKNALGAKRELPVWYWTGRTSMNCLSQTISDSLKNAYAHHIQRLMITGNFALLAGIDPDQVDEWYLGMYIDAFQWVEITNTRGMSQYADGGGIATKPYAASAAYVNKMGNYCKTCSYNPKQRTGPDACPLNSLYWDFIRRHRSTWKQNPRMGIAVKNWDRFSPEEQKAIESQAGEYLNNIGDL